MHLIKRMALTALAALWMPACASADTTEALKAINLPQGFSLQLYAKVPGARTLVSVPALNLVYVGNRRSDSIHAIRTKGDSKQVFKAASGFKVPNGIAWKDGWLYVAEQHRLVRLPALPDGRLDTSRIEVLFGKLPDDSWHGWRYAAFGPDGALYVAVGAPCNVCELSGLEGTIQRFNPQTWEPEPFALGVRNSVGLAFHPDNGDLFFTDNGADMMGDDSPPDELNHAPKAGPHFGYPYYGGGQDRTRDFAGEAPPSDTHFPVVPFNAHVAALGIEFYRGDMFPKDYRRDAFVAQHGSWNRSIPDGYRLMRIKFNGSGQAVGKEIFADGFLKGGSKLGRPVDLETLPDGSLLVSDDHAGAVYRIVYEDR